MSNAVAFDPKELEAKVKAMYRSVAEEPHGEFHFEMGRAMAERLGYAPADLDRIPAESINSFAGVGYYFHLAELKGGETIVDLGSGSGMDTFIAALKVGRAGKVIGIDMTDEQRAKAERLRDRDDFLNVSYLKGYIEQVPLPDGVADVVISNGVVNLATEKSSVFREAARTPEVRRQTRAFRHRHRGAVTREHCVQLDPVGGLHRWRGAIHQLSQPDRGGGTARRQDGRQSAVPVHFGQRQRRLQEIRRQERLAAGAEVLNGVRTCTTSAIERERRCWRR